MKTLRLPDDVRRGEASDLAQAEEEVRSMGDPLLSESLPDHLSSSSACTAASSSLDQVAAAGRGWWRRWPGWLGWVAYQLQRQGAGTARDVPVKKNELFSPTFQPYLLSILGTRSKVNDNARTNKMIHQIDVTLFSSPQSGNRRSSS